MRGKVVVAAIFLALGAHSFSFAATFWGITSSSEVVPGVVAEDSIPLPPTGINDLQEFIVFLGQRCWTTHYVVTNFSCRGDICSGTVDCVFPPRRIDG